MAVVATGTDLVDLVFGATGNALSGVQMVSLVVRAVATFWFAAVAVRQMVGSPAQPWRLDRGIVFVIVWQIAVFVAYGAAALLLAFPKNIVAQAIKLPIDPHVLTLIFVGLATPIIDMLTLRIGPWVVGRTACVSDMTFKVSWCGMRGNWGAATASYLVLVLPLFVIHYALTAWLQQMHLPKNLKIEWTIFDGVESIVMVMVLLSIFVASFARASRRTDTAAIQ